MTNCLVTGGAGFAMSHVVKYLLEETDWNVTVWDCLTYAAEDGYRLRQFEKYGKRFEFEKIDVSAIDTSYSRKDFDYIVHGAAETHVDHSIKFPARFVKTNVVGTTFMLKVAETQRSLKNFLYFSTDEVFGSAFYSVNFGEWSRYNSGNPYAATKAAAEELCLAWENTYGLPVVISHCCNIFGENQHKEKFIPKLVRTILKGEEFVIHADNGGHAGSRQYIWAPDVARAVHLMLLHGKPRTKFNIVGIEMDNETMATTISLFLGKPLRSRKEYPRETRPGWDFSYRLSSSSMEYFGWTRTPDFDACLRRTVEHERLRCGVGILAP